MAEPFKAPWALEESRIPDLFAESGFSLGVLHYIRVLDAPFPIYGVWDQGRMFRAHLPPDNKGKIVWERDDGVIFGSFDKPTAAMVFGNDPVMTYFYDQKSRYQGRPNQSAVSPC